MNSVAALVYNVRQPTVQAGWVDDRLIHSFVQDVTLPTIDEILSSVNEQLKSVGIEQCSIADISISLPTHSIDQGFEEYKSNLYEALVEQITEALPVTVLENLTELALLIELSNVLTTGKLSDFQSHWQRLHQGRDFVSIKRLDVYHKVTSQLKSRMKERAWRRAVAQSFTVQEIAQLFSWLEEENSEYILTFIEFYLSEGDRLIAEQRERTRNSTANELQSMREVNKVDQAALVEFSLAYSVIERGGQFNKISYMRGMLRSIAAHYNQSTTDLCLTIRASIQAINVSKLIRQELQEILDWEYGAQTHDPSRESGSHRVDALAVNVEFETTNGSENDALITAVSKLLMAGRSQLLAFLNSEANPEDILKTLARTLPTEVLARLAEALDYKEARSLHNHLSALINAFSQHPVVDLQDVNEAVHFTLLRSLWQQTQGRQRDVTLEAILSQVIRHLLTKCAYQFLPPRYVMSPVLNGPQDLNDVIAIDLQQAALHCFEAGPTRPDVAESVESFVAIHALEQYLRGTASTFDQKYSVAMSFDGLKAIRRPLLKYFQNSLIRNRFLLLDDRIQEAVLSAAIPDFSHSIQPMWQAQKTLNKTVLPEGLKSVASSSRLGDVLREFSLIVLSHNRGSEFNQRSFARSLIRLLSARYNLAYQQVLTLLQRSIVASDNSSSLDYLFEDLELEPVSQPEFEQAVDGDQENNEFSGFVCYELLSKWLANSHVIEAQRVQTLLHQLRTYDPVLAYRFYQQIEQQVSRGVFRVYLDEPEVLKHVLNFALTIAGYLTRENTLTLTRAIDGYARQTKSPAVFYRTTLTHVLRNDTLDLDQISEMAECDQGADLSVVNSQVTREPTEYKSPSADSLFELITQSFMSFGLPCSIGVRDSQQHELSVSGQVYRWPADCNTLLTTWFRTLQTHPEGLLHFGRLTEAQKVKILSLCHMGRFANVWPIVQALRVCLSTDKSIWSESELICAIDCVLVATFSGDLPSNNSALFVQQVVSQLRQFASRDSQHNFQRTIRAALQTSVGHLRWLKVQPRAQETASAISALIAVEAELDQMDFESTEALSALGHSPHSGSEADDSYSTDRHSQLLTNTMKALNRFQHGLDEEVAWRTASDVGVVLLSPYLPALFERCELLSERKFRDKQASEKALALLNYLCTGDEPNRNTDTFSWASLLLANFSPQEPVFPTASISSVEKQMCDGLIEAVIAHWSALGKTTPAGLREIFLQRNGQLCLDDEKGWRVLVSKRPFDVLLKRLPWGMSVIKHSFMTERLFVEWG